MITQDRGVYY